jgi:hypothetical protein
MRKSIIKFYILACLLTLSACDGLTSPIAKSTTATPTFSVAAGSVAASTVVTISCATEGATIQYSTDGTTYQTGSSYAVAASCTLYAKAMKTGYTDSAVASAAYTVGSSQVATPTFSVASGAVSYASAISIGCATLGATILYSTDGTNYTAGSSYVVTRDCTLFAKATLSGYADSAVTSAALTLSGISLQLSHTFGTKLTGTSSGSSGKNIYVAWIRNSSGTFVQNLGVCAKLLANAKYNSGASTTASLTGVVLPYWQKNVYPASISTEVDAVSSATKADQSFDLAARALKDISQRKFTAYFETDCSFEDNDWFSDQPAIVYSADIDLDSGVTEYELVPCGWARNAYNYGSDSSLITNTASIGSLQSELRYIVKHMSGTDFGVDDANSATLRVAKVVLKIQ